MITATTDVRNVSLCQLEDTNSYLIQCGHVAGSNVQGCVYFFGTDVTGIIARNNSAGVTVELADINSYSEVLVYDLEIDNTTGTLPIRMDVSGIEMCPTSTNSPTDTLSLGNLSVESYC